MSEEETQATGQSAMMMPFFMGGPWVPKFSGTGSEVKFGEWRSQTETMLSFQPIRDSQKADFVLGLLEGEAKREILTLDRTDRNNPRKIFEVLSELYGDNTHASTLRAQFFNCRQEPNQSLRSFSLRLRELFSRLKQKDETGLEQGDVLLRDQFIMGLKEGPIRQELRRQVRKTPRVTFDEVKMEALALEEEQEEQWIPSGCLAVSRPTLGGPKPVTDWKQELRTEIMNEVKEQMTAMTKTILDELRDSNRMSRVEPRPHAASGGTNRGHRPRAPYNNAKYKWDPQGRPICNVCEEAGHIGRYCPSKASSQDF